MAVAAPLQRCHDRDVPLPYVVLPRSSGGVAPSTRRHKPPATFLHYRALHMEGNPPGLGPCMLQVLLPTTPFAQIFSSIQRWAQTSCAPVRECACEYTGCDMVHKSTALLSANGAPSSAQCDRTEKPDRFRTRRNTAQCIGNCNTDKHRVRESAVTTQSKRRPGEPSRTTHAFSPSYNNRPCIRSGIHCVSW